MNRLESSTPRRIRCHGFSLLEMLVVLLILGIVAGVSTPAIGRFLDNLAFRKQTADILAAVRYARLMAITKSKTVTLTIDERDRTAVKFSGGVEEVREIALEEDSSFAFDPDEITFYPDGLSTPAEIRSARKERSTEFSLAPLTGLPVRK